MYRSTLRGICLLAALAFCLSAAFAQTRNPSSNLWRDVQQNKASSVSRSGAVNHIKASSYRLLMLEPGGMRRLLAKAPVENLSRPSSEKPPLIELPRPDGTEESFAIEEVPVMAPELAQRFPEIKTYVGRGVENPRAYVRLDFTPAGFHAQVLSGEGETYYIDPFYHLQQDFYMSYFRHDAIATDENGMPCLTEDADQETLRSLRNLAEPEATIGTQRRTYRLAQACTGEYTAFHGGTVAFGQAAIVTAINRVSGVLEVEAAIRLQLVANNSSLVYTNASTDPYTNTNTSTMRGQNQTTVDSVIGAANYDIGHVFGTGDGGIVGSIGNVCIAGQKARGVTGRASPVGDAFWIDYVIHEMGHQFGAYHTYNSCGGGQSGNNSEYEPGSGTTIMGYAGICNANENLQPNSDPYFHAVSVDSIIAYTTTGNGTCSVNTASGNQPPTVPTGAPATIPNNTPFALTAIGSDPDGDALTYCWEQYNLGVPVVPGTDNGSSPIIRSFNPAASPTRIIPRLSNLLANTTVLGEKLPTYTGAATRVLNFRVTARDNRGGVATSATVPVTVATAAGPFNVTSQNTTGLSFIGGTPFNVTWNVAGTTANGINAATVNLRFSKDGGNNFNYFLAANVPNNGGANVTLPYGSASSCRVKVEPTNNIFFAINTQNFVLTAATDSDGDGMPDSYETTNSLNPGNPADGPTDADGDGESNFEEYIAGTAANNPIDRLRITSITRASGDIALVFPSKLARTYRLERFSVVGGSPTTIASGIAGTGDNITRTDIPPGTPYFYRVIAEI